MSNEIPKNESTELARTKQESKFYASFDKHGFKLLVIFFIVLIVLCFTPTVLVVGDFIKGDALNGQYQTIFFTTFITLFGLLITGIFLFMTFRVEHGAKIEAREEARDIAKERVNAFVLKAGQDIDVFKTQAIESLEQTEVAAAEKIQEIKKQVTEHSEQTEVAVAEKIKVLKAQAIDEVTREVGELMEETANKMRNARKGSPSQSDSAG